jgi:hypothetical protein
LLISQRVNVYVMGSLRLWYRLIYTLSTVMSQGAFGERLQGTNHGPAIFGP